MNEIMVPPTERLIADLIEELTTRSLSPAAKRQKIKQVAEFIHNSFLQAIAKERFQRDLALGWIEETPEGYKLTELGKEHLTLGDDGQSYLALN